MVKRVRSDAIAALLLALLGAAMLAGSFVYPVGTLTHMGPGFFPRAIGILMIAIALLVAASGRQSAPLGAPAAGDVRGWLCILGGIVAFTVVGKYGGLAPATFAIVFLSALGNRRNSLRDATLFAAAMTVVGVVVFGLILKIQMPLIGPGAS